MLETGFLHKSLLGNKGDCRNPVSRCSGGGQKPGFSTNLGWEAKIIAETRFLGALLEVRNRVSYPNLGEDAKIIAETRFLSRKNYQRNPVSKFLSHSTATNVELHKKDRQQLSTVFDECVFDSVVDDV